MATIYRILANSISNITKFWLSHRNSHRFCAHLKRNNDFILYIWWWCNADEQVEASPPLEFQTPVTSDWVTTIIYQNTFIWRNGAGTEGKSNYRQHFYYTQHITISVCLALSVFVLVHIPFDQNTSFLFQCKAMLCTTVA